jgi:hypothetical protein
LGNGDSRQIAEILLMRIKTMKQTNKDEDSFNAAISLVCLYTYDVERIHAFIFSEWLRKCNAHVQISGYAL